MTKHSPLIILFLLAAVCITATADRKKHWPKDPQYVARRTATIQAMDSVLHGQNTDPEPFLNFAEEKFKEFDYDPTLMQGFASAFATQAGFIDQSKQLYRRIKEMYPHDITGYLDYAATMHSYGTKILPGDEGKVRADIKDDYRKLAKAQIDSAKVALPKSKEPYKSWFRMCARFAFVNNHNSKENRFITEIEEEVKAYQKAFPDVNAYYDAADEYRQIIEEGKLEIADFSTKDQKDFMVNAMMNNTYLFDKANPKSLSFGQLNNLSYYYYDIIGKYRKYFDTQARISSFEKGLELAKIGEQLSPDSSNFYRLQLYHSAELSKYDKDQMVLYSTEANQAAEKLFQKSSVTLREDYFYNALALQNLQKYDAAIEMYQKALEKKLPYYDPQYNCDSLKALDNTIDCYQGLKNTYKALEETYRLNDLKTRHGYSLKRSDIMALVRLYNSIGNNADSTRTNEERYQAYLQADTLYAVLQDSIDNGTPQFDNIEAETPRCYFLYMQMNTRGRIDRMEEYKDREDHITLEIADRLIARLEPLESTFNDAEKQFICAAYDKRRFYYAVMKDYREALKYIEKVEKIQPGIYEKDDIDKYRKQAKKQR